MKKMLLLIGLFSYGANILSSGPVPKTLRSFMNAPAFEDAKEAEWFTFVAGEFRNRPVLTQMVNPFEVGVPNKGWFHEILTEGCAKGNAQAQEIRIAYDAVYYSTTDSWWEHYHWEHDKHVLESEGLSPATSSDEFFTIIKARKNYRDAKTLIQVTTSYVQKEVSRISDKIQDTVAFKDPQDFIEHAEWLKKWRDTGLVDLKPPMTFDYYISLNENHAAQLTKWKQDSEKIKAGLVAGKLSDECLQALKDMKRNPFMLHVQLDFYTEFPRLKAEFERADTIESIASALKFLKEIEDAQFNVNAWQTRVNLENKKRELEKNAPDNKNPDNGKKDNGKKTKKPELSQLPLNTVVIVLLAAGCYLTYRWYHKQPDTRENAETDHMKV